MEPPNEDEARRGNTRRGAGETTIRRALATQH
jgi:hypothetical protein